MYMVHGELYQTPSWGWGVCAAAAVYVSLLSFVSPLYHFFKKRILPQDSSERLIPLSHLLVCDVIFKFIHLFLIPFSLSALLFFFFLGCSTGPGVFFTPLQNIPTPLCSNFKLQTSNFQLQIKILMVQNVEFCIFKKGLFKLKDLVDNCF